MSNLSPSSQARAEQEAREGMKTEVRANPPSGWHEARIGDLTFSTEQRNPGRDPEKRFIYVDVSSVSNTSFRITEPIELSGAQAPSRARKVIRVGDVLFATVRPTLKRVALVSEALDDQIASTAFMVLRTDKSRLESSYLYYRLLTDEFIERMRELERGANYPAVRASDICNEGILVPALAEQRKIAAVLGLVQRAIEQQERLIALTTELKKALLHKLFTQGLSGEPQKQTEIGPVPQSWEVRRLGDYARVVNGYAFKSQDYVMSGVRLIRISNVATGTLIEKDDKYLPAHFLSEQGEYALEEGDLILSLTRPIISDGIKFCFVRKNDLPALLNQ